MPTIRIMSLAIITGVSFILASDGSRATPAPGGVSIPVGYDLFETPPNGASFKFTNPAALPAGFFGPGSEPFQGRVVFSGVPLGDFDGTNAGAADTIVERRSGLDLSGPGGSDTVPIELVALNLVSVQPITVTYGGTRKPEQWNVLVDLSDQKSSTGALKVDQVTPNGGTFESTLTVRPIFTFISPTGKKRTLDLGLPQYDALSNLVRIVGRGPWTTTPCPGDVFYVDRPEFGGGWCPLFKPAGVSSMTLRSRLIQHRIGPARWVEIDYFPDSKAQVRVITPTGGDATVQLTGPATVRVIIGPGGHGARDTDGDGKEQVQTEIVAMDLRGSSPVGPVRVRVRPFAQHPFKRSIGEIEERTNDTPGVLDLAPFKTAPTGDPPYLADSFFDVFVEVSLQGKPQHTDRPKRMKAVISYKPPEPFATYQSPQVIPLFDRRHRPTGFKLGTTKHTPRPFELDVFETTTADIEVITPDGPLTVQLSGPTEVKVHIGKNGEAGDADNDGLDDVKTEMVRLDLAGTTPLGLVQVHLRDPAKHPKKRTLGVIEEQVNDTPGILDVDPFGDGLANSFFDVFFEVGVGPNKLHSHAAKRMRAVISHKPPGAGDIYFSPTVIPLFTEDEQDSGFKIGNTRHVPQAPRIINFGSVAVFLHLQQGMTPVDVPLTGSLRVALYSDAAGTARDRDGDGLDEAPIEIVGLALTGNSILGSIGVSLRDPALHPGKRSLGFVEEKVNTVPGRLDLPPSGLGIGVSFFDIFFEVTIGTTVLHNDAAQGLIANVGGTPAGPGDEFQDSSPGHVPLMTAAETPAGKEIRDLRIVPMPTGAPPPGGR